MKRKNWFTGFLVCIFTFGVLFVSCDSSVGEFNPVAKTFSGTSNGATYTLVITQLARFAAGDTYVLTIVKSGVEKKSAGTISAITLTSFTLKPNSSGSQSFSLTFSGTTITSITGTISYDNGTSETGPGSFTGSNNPGTNMVAPVMSEEFFTTTQEGAFAGTKIPTTSFSRGQGIFIYRIGSYGSNGLVKAVITIKSGSTVVSERVDDSYDGIIHPGSSFSGYHGTFRVDTAGNYTVEMYVEDTEGKRSNTVSAAFTVTK